MIHSFVERDEIVDAERWQVGWIHQVNDLPLETGWSCRRFESTLGRHVSISRACTYACACRLTDHTYYIRRDLFAFAIYINLKHIRTAARCGNVLAVYLAFRIPLTFNGRFARLTFATDAPRGGGRGAGAREIRGTGARRTLLKCV